MQPAAQQMRQVLHYEQRALAPVQPAADDAVLAIPPQQVPPHVGFAPTVAALPAASPALTMAHQRQPTQISEDRTVRQQRALSGMRVASAAMTMQIWEPSHRPSAAAKRCAILELNKKQLKETYVC